MEEKRINNENEQLRKCHKKLIWEGILKSLIFGLTLGLANSFLLAFVLFFTNINGIVLIISSGLVIFIASTITFYFTLFKPSMKHTATRVDSVGLEERVITMLELDGNESVIAKKQREDALDKIQTVTPKQVKFSKFLKPIVGLSIAVVLSAFMITMHQVRMRALSAEKPIIIIPVVPKQEEDIIIEELIEGLRELVDNADVRDELKLELHLLIDHLESYVYDLETINQKIAAISETRDEILRRIAEEINKIIWISDELQKRDSTVLIGNAIESKDPADVDIAINDMIDRFKAMEYNEQKEHMLLTTIEDLEDSLEAANEKNDELRQILKDLIEILKKMLQVIQSEGDIPKATEEMESELKQLGDQMKEALEDMQADEEELGEDMSDLINDALDELEGMAPKDENEQQDDEKENEESNTPDDPIQGGGKPIEAGKQTVIDGVIMYENELNALIEELNDRIANDSTLTSSERNVLNAYLANIIRQINEQNQEND